MTRQKLPLFGKEDPCFQTYRRTARAAQCVKSSALDKVIETIIYIE